MAQSAPNALTMSDRDFKAISDIAYKEAGLVFKPEKVSLVQSRINRRLRHLKINSFSEYTTFIESEQGFAERKVMISSLTTNVSNFFRESHHFDILREQVFPNLLSCARAGGKVRLWSAGCSTGQEPYSMAMTLLDIAPDATKLDIKILATDIDPNVISTAKQGYYNDRSIEDIGDDFQERFTEKVNNGHKTGIQMTEALRSMISFRELNLLSKWPISGKFDVIFCRNVVIYFDESTQLSLWPRFESVTAPDGWLFVGHSERLSERLETKFVTAGPTAYHHPSSSDTQI